MCTAQKRRDVATAAGLKVKPAATPATNVPGSGDVGKGMRKLGDRSGQRRGAYGLLRDGGSP